MFNSVQRNMNLSHFSFFHLNTREEKFEFNYQAIHQPPVVFSGSHFKGEIGKDLSKPIFQLVMSLFVSTSIKIMK